MNTRQPPGAHFLRKTQGGNLSARLAMFSLLLAARRILTTDNSMMLLCCSVYRSLARCGEALAVTIVVILKKKK